MSKQLFTIAMLLVMGLSAKAAVWPDENQWSDAWELKYKEWVRTHAGAKFFSNEKLASGEPNPYYGIRVDCADLVYTHRVIFSFENKLPFSMVNPVAPKSALISNQVTRYDQTAAGVPRLKKFLTWMYDLVSTHSLPNDTYSVSYNRVGPGTIILTSKKNHHSWTVVDITKTGNPRLVFNSTVGRTSGLLVQERQSWPNPFWVFEAEVDKDDETKKINIYKSGTYAGFRYWRPEAFLKQSETLVPGYSDEQHLVGVGKWITVAQASLAKVKETVDQVVMRLLKDACSDLKQRIEAVQEAETFKTNLAADFAAGKTEDQSSDVRDFMRSENKPSDIRCMTYNKFDEYSTPSRDKRFVDALMLARGFFKAGLNKFGEEAFAHENLNLYYGIFSKPKLSAAEEVELDKTTKPSAAFCTLKVNDSLGFISLAESKRRIFASRFSSNPNDAPTGRFGYARTSKDLATKCSAYDLEAKPYNLNQIESEMLKEVLASPTLQ